jgi:hypothetical protein
MPTCQVIQFVPSRQPLCADDDDDLIKSRTGEPEQQPLLANGSEITFVSRQRLGKHVPPTTDKHATIDVLLETVFFTRFMQRGL